LNMRHGLFLHRPTEKWMMEFQPISLSRERLGLRQHGDGAINVKSILRNWSWSAKYLTIRAYPIEGLSRTPFRTIFATMNRKLARLVTVANLQRPRRRVNGHPSRSVVNSVVHAGCRNERPQESSVKFCDLIHGCLPFRLHMPSCAKVTPRLHPEFLAKWRRLVETSS
jgi:hypothetical protein